MNQTVDAVVIGAGINGLVAAAELARGGWSVALVERNPEPGGFIASGEVTAPGFVHDTFSSWHPEFVTGGAYATLGEDLHAHGLRYVNTERHITGTVRRDGSAVLAHRDRWMTVEAFVTRPTAPRTSTCSRAWERRSDRSAGCWAASCARVQALPLLARLARDERCAGLERLLRDTVTSGRAYCRRTFAGDEIDALWAPWLLHAGLSPDHASGAVMIPLFAFTLHAAGHRSWKAVRRASSPPSARSWRRTAPSSCWASRSSACSSRAPARWAWRPLGARSTPGAR